MGFADEVEGGKGNKGMNIAFGALAQYYAVEFEVFPGPDGAVLHLF